MSLYKACKEILENGISTHTIGNNDISIELPGLASLFFITRGL